MLGYLAFGFLVVAPTVVGIGFSIALHDPGAALVGIVLTIIVLMAG